LVTGGEALGVVTATLDTEVGGRLLSVSHAVGLGTGLGRDDVGPETTAVQPRPGAAEEEAVAVAVTKDV
jgi:hypothetical protein